MITNYLYCEVHCEVHSANPQTHTQPCNLLSPLKAAIVKKESWNAGWADPEEKQLKELEPPTAPPPRTRVHANPEANL